MSTGPLNREAIVTHPGFNLNKQGWSQVYCVSDSLSAGLREKWIRIGALIITWDGGWVQLWQHGFPSWASSKYLVMVDALSWEGFWGRVQALETHRPQICHSWLGYFILFTHQWQRFPQSEPARSHLLTKIVLLNPVLWCISYSRSRKKRNQIASFQRPLERW